MFNFRFKKDSSLAKTLALLLPFTPSSIDKFLKDEFSGDRAKRKWSKVFLFVGLLTVFSFCLNPAMFVNKDIFWSVWLILFTAGLLLCFGSILSHLKNKDREIFDKKIIFILCLYGFGIWVYYIVRDGLGSIWPNLVIDELAVFGFGILATRQKWLAYGLIMFLISFIISVGYFLAK